MDQNRNLSVRSIWTKFQNFEAQNDLQNEPKNQFFVPILTIS